MNYSARKAGPQGSLAEAMFGDRYATGFTGSVGQRADGSTGMMSSYAKARQKMSPVQLALNDASAERRAKRKQEAKALRQKRVADRRQARLQSQQPGVMLIPLLAYLTGQDPQAAAELAVDLRGQDLRARADQVSQAMKARDVESNAGLRDLEWLSDLLDLRTKMRLHGD
ncbi:hypothetical protein [Stieleria maiorica]|nr:hypothetical protein [Stieleria maiorica]